MGNRLLIFDLDGTINDSSPGIMHCYRMTGRHYGRNDLPDSLLRTGLSGPFVDNISRILELRQDQIMEAINIYTDYYVKEGQSMSRLYPGIRETLEYLRGEGFILSVATMMAEDYAKKTLEDYGIRDLFDSVNGASMTVLLTKQDLIERCIRDTGAGTDETLMIGDGTDDHKAALQAGIGFLGVTYGYEINRDYCTSNNVPYADSPEDLRRLS